MIAALWIIPSSMVALALACLVVSPRYLRGIRGLAIAYLVGLLVAQGFGLWRAENPLASWFFMTVAVFTIFGIWYSGPYIAREAAAHQWSPQRVRAYYSLFLLFAAFLMALALWTNFVCLWLALEGATLSSVVLVAVPDSSRALEAAWKYVMVTEVGGLIALLGTILALHAAAMPLFAWHGVPSHPVSLTQQHWALIGAYLALVGYAAKAGLAPFHTWLPDAHSEAPAPVSAMLSGLKLAGAIIIIYRLFEVVAMVVSAVFLQDALIILGLLSLVVAASFLVFQRDLKRFWAYSSIEHIGLISLGVGFGGIALIGAALHIWTHAASKTLLFHNAGTVRLLYRSSHMGQGARAILHRTPWTGTLLALGSAAIVGLPPFAPFWSEWLILAGGFHQPADRVYVLIAALLLVAIFIAIARRLPDWLFRPGRVGIPAGERIAEPMALVLPSVGLGILVVGGGIGLPIFIHPLWHHLVGELMASPW